MAVAAKWNDRVGLGWRSEIAAGIFAHLDKIDVVEVIAENYFHSNKKTRDGLRFLAQQIPLSLHGVSMGLATSLAADQKIMEKMARLVDYIEPEFWSEHLAFVRAGGVEIGHLAAPPRNLSTIEGALKNIAIAASLIGSKPRLENVATLINPPASSLTEVEWIKHIIDESNTSLLLDLHNLYANAVNFGLDPIGVLQSLPLRKVSTIHLSGGCWINEPDTAKQRLLDDHVHDVPDCVFAFLTEVASCSEQHLTVIIERDGRFPPMADLLLQIERARYAIHCGREQKVRS